MPSDSRENAAAYYDLSPTNPDDVPFYRNRVSSPDATILELGCGTGRVLVPLASSCSYIHGIDSSEAMLDICRNKLLSSGISAVEANVEPGDISAFDLDRTFDLIIAPFRVIQNLESDDQIDGLFRGIRNHLKPGGTCILNVFRPNRNREELTGYWQSQGEKFDWETRIDGDRLTRHSRVVRVDQQNLVVYPELVYRRYRGDALNDETILSIAMRCYYPVEFIGLIEDRGFTVRDRWGGYAGEPYGEGPELIVQFDDSA